MKDWTDDELGTLLTEAFKAHEDGVDPAAAHRVAATTPKPRHAWPTIIAAAATVALAIGATAYLAGSSENAGTHVAQPTPTPGITVPTGTDSEYFAFAQRDALRVLNLAKVPASAVRLSRAPSGWPVSENIPRGPADPRLTRTAWFSTPLTAEQVEQFLLSHPPVGFTKRDRGLARRSSGLHYFAFDVKEQSSPAVIVYTRLLVQWYQQGERTILRFDTIMLSRHARTTESVVTGSVTRVDIDRVRRDIDPRGFLNPQVLPRVTITDRARIDRLVAATNSLYGSNDPQFHGFCPFPGDPRPGTTLTFHSPTQQWTFSWETSCDGQVQVKRDNHRLELTLNPSGLQRIVDDLIGG